MNIWVASALLCLGGAPIGAPVGIDDPAANADRRAASEIQKALRAEDEGRDFDRRRHLEAALEAAPEHPLAHGLLGSVATDGKWVSVAEAVERARRDDRTWRRASTYHEKRQGIPDSSEAHFVLGRWCATAGLRAEAQAHFTMAVRLDPDNEEAWRRLGRRWHDGRWLTGEEIAAEVAEAAEQARADEVWLPRLAGLKTDLKLGRQASKTQNDLAAISDPRAVPSIERVFGSDKGFDQAWRVWLLSRIDSSESSRALAALVSQTRDTAVRAAATRVLAARDPRVYLGFLINQMRDIENRQVILDNARIARALRALTGQPFQFDREPWAAWWSDQLGYRPPPVDLFPRPVAYESIASPVTPLPPSQWAGSATSPPSWRSCFAAGTLVVSRTGLAPIEDLELGDQVLSQDTNTGALSLQPILSIEHDPPEATLRIDFDDQPIVCTGIHRFWKVGVGWVMARDIRPGDRVRALGRATKVRAITWNRIQPVHNIEVARNQNFFVGLAGFLVHDSTLVSPIGGVFDVDR